MRILILGGTGMLGHKLAQQLSPSNDVITTVRGTKSDLLSRGIAEPAQILTDIDLKDEASLERVIREVEPDVTINAAGVIKQRPSSSDVITTLTINSILPHRLAELAGKYGFRLIVISTDCVFSGESGMYREDDPADALDLYGRSKNFGEVAGQNCLTIRTSIIGRELESRHSLVEWFLSNRGNKVRGFRKAIYSGFPTIVFADIISQILTRHPDLNGIWHISSDPIDKFSLLQMLDRAYGAGVQIEPDDSFVIDRSLDCSRFKAATGFVAPSWAEMVDRMVADPTPYEIWKR
jgi:dTDP-4-dehydrorhamnose reductase